MRARTFLNNKTPPHIITLVLMTALSSLAMNIFLPSLPSISAFFSEDKSIVQLTITLYLFATAFLQPIVGPLSDYYGRRPIVLFGLGGFFVGTFVCIYATSIEWLLLGRLIQALSATGMVTSRAIIRDMVGREKAASMIGYVTMGMAVAPMIGPIIGGYLDEYFQWQANFWLLMFFGIITTIIIWADLGETRKSAAANLSSQFSYYPILLKSRRFWGYALSATCTSGVFFLILGGGPYVATEYYQLTPSQFGIYFAAITVGYMIGNFVSGRFAQRIGIYLMMSWGNFMVGAGVAISCLLYFLIEKNPLVFFLPMTLVGIGNGMTLPNSNAGIVSLYPKLAGAASGLGGFIQIFLGALFSIAAGFVLGPQSDPLPLLILMLMAVIFGMCATYWVGYVDRVENANSHQDGNEVERINEQI